MMIIGGSLSHKRHWSRYAAAPWRPGLLVVSNFIWWQHQMKRIFWHIYDHVIALHTFSLKVKMAGKRRVSMPASILSTIPEVVVHQSDNNRNGSSSIFGPFLRKTSLFANKSEANDANRRSSLVDTWAIRRGKNHIFVNILTKSRRIQSTYWQS